VLFVFKGLIRSIYTALPVYLPKTNTYIRVYLRTAESKTKLRMLKMVSNTRTTCYSVHGRLGLLPFHPVSDCDYTYVLYMLDLHGCLHNDVVCTFKIFRSNDRVNDNDKKRI